MRINALKNAFWNHYNSVLLIKVTLQFNIINFCGFLGFSLSRNFVVFSNSTILLLAL